MKQFSNMSFEKPKSPEKEYLFKGNHTKVVKAEHDWEVVENIGGAVCIPHIIETNEIILREELVPSYKYVDGKEKHLVVVGGGIDNGESPEQAIIRELEEEAGIKINVGWVNMEKWGEMFSNKNSTSKIHIFYFPLSIGDYSVVQAKGDGSYVEDNSYAVRVNIDWIESLKPADLVTNLCLEFFKNKVLNNFQ